MNERNKPMTDESLMPFGKHKGKALANVPPDYLLWLWDNDIKGGPLRDYIRDNLDVIRDEIEKKKQKR